MSLTPKQTKSQTAQLMFFLCLLAMVQNLLRCMQLQLSDADLALGTWAASSKEWWLLGDS